MTTVYHNPRCKKSRAGLAYVREKGVEPEIVEYIKNPLSPAEIGKLLQQLNMEPLEVVRKQEEVYRKKLKGKEFTKDEWLKILSENPKLIQRPIVVKGHKAVIADPPENADDLL